jgi:hypothetical protein
MIGPPQAYGLDYRIARHQGDIGGLAVIDDLEVDDGLLAW